MFLHHPEIFFKIILNFCKNICLLFYINFLFYIFLPPIEIGSSTPYNIIIFFIELYLILFLPVLFGMLVLPHVQLSHIIIFGAESEPEPEPPPPRQQATCCILGGDPPDPDAYKNRELRVYGYRPRHLFI